MIHSLPFHIYYQRTLTEFRGFLIFFFYAMDTSIASLAKPNIFFRSVPIPSGVFTFRTRFTRSPAKSLMGYSATVLNVSSCGSSMTRGRAKLLVVSLFRRPPRRRNSLREKLIPCQDHTTPSPKLSNPESSSGNLYLRGHESNGHGLCMNLDAVEESAGAGGSNKFDFPGNSVLWDKLEKWLDRFKEDFEFWGMGTGPIFTIFQDSHGNVTQVSVNENEIMKRSRFQALSLVGNQEREKLKDVNCKISRARIIAKEIEIGAYHMPMNSSIAKFVVDGNKSSLVCLLHAFSSRGENLIRICPGIGLVALCCFCVLGMAQKLHVGHNDVELTGEEIEMLRRKKKSRIERKDLQKGSVEVLQNGDELPMISGTVPQLDRNELMKNIVQTKKSRDRLVLSDPSDNFTAKNHDFDMKVREIREMVKKVHDVEHDNLSSNGHKGEQGDLASIKVHTEFQLCKEKSVKEHACSDNAAKSSSHSCQENNTVDCMDILAEELAISNGESSLGESLTNIGTSRNNDVAGIEGQETSYLTNSQKMLVGIDMSDSGAQDAVFLSNKVDVKRDMVDNNSVRCEQTRKALSVTSNNKRGMFKVITSLKEANEYLSTKYRIPIESVQLEKPILSKRAPDLSNYADRSDCNLSRTRESAKASGVAPALSDFRLHVNDGKVNKSSVGTQHIVEMNLTSQNGESSEGPAKVINVDERADLDDILVEDSGDVKLDCLTSGTKVHNQTSQYCVNQNYCDHTSQNTQVAKSKDIQSDNSSLTVTLDQVDGMMLKGLSCTEEHRDEQLDHVAQVGRSEYVTKFPDAKTDETNVKKDLPIFTRSNVLKSSESEHELEISQSSVSTNWEPNFDKCRENDNIISQSFQDGNGVSGYFDPNAVNTSFSSKSEDALEDISSKASISSNYSNSEGQNENMPKTSRKSWVEGNFHQFDSIIEKISIGFKENYKLAKVKAQENSLSSAEMGKLGLWLEDEELEWMKDDKLLEIVLQVRENELAGRDPFYLMDADDQQAFFLGLERKAEKVNEKLAGVHEWIHSKIENLDYGADGISLDDPLEKIIPRWRGLPIDQDPEFLRKFINNGNSVLAENIRNLDSGPKLERFQKSENLPKPDDVTSYPSVNDPVKFSETATSTPPRTLIECSDGSSRFGKKKLKEQWKHTKKWSQGFLEVYNAETDPEVKSILKDMGKDLDRWITDKDKENATDLMTRMPKKKRRFIEKKVNRVKKEMEKYGAQAVFSKYKEYAGEKGEDYLWWLDLQFVLCIELYYVEDDAPRIGFYSLEMAEDLELNPKQHHVIAFEDAGDSKNFCHIVQAQMDMLGNGKAFVVPRPPKDAFREAKANGFSVILIKKGELKMNVDQTLEEVEEELVELGSKFYHDKIMSERGVNIRSLIKGMIAADMVSKRS